MIVLIQNLKHCLAQKNFNAIFEYLKQLTLSKARKQRSINKLFIDPCFKILALFFEDGIESFEILHTKHANFKGTDHDFCWSGKPIHHLQKQGNIHIFHYR